MSKKEEVRMRSTTLRLVGAALVVAVVAALSAASVTASPAKSGKSLAGGTYRVGWESSFGWTNGFDPTGEYLANAFAIYSSLLVRTLVGYNHVAGAAGNKLVPDLATTVAKPTNGGMRYTYKLKSGIRFAPPVGREITSKDVQYALERAARPKNGAQYGFYYAVIRGWDAYAAGKTKSIAGIKTPNNKTIVFDLTAPTGDFPYRLAMSAAGPIPQEVGKCFEGQPGKYGLDLVASGPYMIEGSDKLDASSCSALKPVSGFSETQLSLVRNPNYSASTDSKAARENNPDRFEFLVNTNLDDIYNKIARGDYQDEYASPSPKVIRQYQIDSSKRKYVKINSGDQTNYLTMNLTQPPFDDLAVRRAMNWVIDRGALRKAWGGPSAGDVAEHILPNAMLNGILDNFHPFKTPNDAGSVTKALAEMKKSKYAHNSSGVCTANECKKVLLIMDVRDADKKMLPVVQAGAAKIGITFTVRQVNGAYPVIQTPSKNIPISTRPRWGKDYADPSTFIDPLFNTILSAGNTNYSLVGLTPAVAKKLKITGNVANVPSIAAQAKKCASTVGDVRPACYAQIDRILTTQIVPWVPYLWREQVNILAPNVAKWTFDQNAGLSGFGHVALSS
jgi:peptide/nickel transport system substrate-binding protein